MKYTVRVILINCDNGKEKSFERTITFEKERLSFAPHDPAPIDVDQKRRVIALALAEATRDAIDGYPA